MDWLEGLEWAGMTAVGTCFILNLFLPLNLLAIGVIYVSSLISWLFLTRKNQFFERNARTSSGRDLKVLLRQCLVLHRECKAPNTPYGGSEMYRWPELDTCHGCRAAAS